MAISLRLSDEDAKLIKNYAKMHNISLSDLFRNAVIERIEDEYDIELYRQAMAEYEENPVTYTHAEVKKRLGLD